MSYDVFISYSSVDEKIALEICHVLEQNDLKCWMAPRNIPKGEYYANYIVKAIKSTTMVLLVYSRHAQESRYVKTEIKHAFENEKPILSFNITDRIPDKEMGYFLKITQWMAGYPDPEDKFTDLIENVFRLCKKGPSRPISCDLADFDPVYMSRMKEDYISLILLFSPIYWASFLYMGLVGDENLWKVSGLIYLIPSIFCIIFLYQIWGILFIHYPVFQTFYWIYLLFWILAIAHGLLIRNEFLTRRIVLRLTSVDDDYFDRLIEEYSKI